MLRTVYCLKNYDDDDLLSRLSKVSKLVIISCQRKQTGDCLLQRVRMPMTVCCVSRIRKLMTVCSASWNQDANVGLLPKEKSMQMTVCSICGDCLLQRVRMPMTVCCVMCMQSKEADDGVLCLVESRCQCWSAA
jgi:hypothetical protein